MHRLETCVARMRRLHSIAVSMPHPIQWDSVVKHAATSCSESELAVFRDLAEFVKARRPNSKHFESGALLF